MGLVVAVADLGGVAKGAMPPPPRRQKSPFALMNCGDLATGKTSETIFISTQAQLIRLRPKAACVARA